LKLWRIVLLLAAGTGYGLLQPGQLTYAFGQSTLYVLLPALLFEAAWNLRWGAIVRGWRAIAVLAVPGVLLTALLIAGALAVVHVPLATGLLAGAILSATDPIAVVAVFRRMRVPALLATIVECESLFNDAVAVALYRAVLLAVAGSELHLLGVAGIAALAIGGAIGGIALGIAIAFVAAAALRNRGGGALQMTVTLVCAYGSYFAADRIGWSGIFATIACGIALRTFERQWMSLTVAENVHQFWEVLALGANAIVFFLVGAAISIAAVWRNPAFVLATLAGVLVARVAVSGLLLPSGYPREWLDVIRVAGMRGALCLALAISLPGTLADRNAIINATFVVALATIVSSALTVPPVVERAARIRRSIG
jgi:monovalent cation:H+ antiporter, CPA1 family